MVTGGPVGTPWQRSGRMRRSSGRYSSQPLVIARIALRSSRTRAQVAHEILQRIERQLFVAAVDHLGGDAVLVLALGSQPAGRLSSDSTAPYSWSCGSTGVIRSRSPQCQYRDSNPLDRRRPARERHVGGRHLRRHHADEIVLADQPIERVDQRLSDGVRCADVDVVGIEKQDEQARARAALPSSAIREPCSARTGRPADPAARIDHVLELLDVSAARRPRGSRSRPGSGPGSARRPWSDRRRRERSWPRCERSAVAAAPAFAQAPARAAARTAAGKHRALSPQP